MATECTVCMYNHNIQGDNYNVPYYRQFSQWILFELVSMLETCLSYKSHMNGAKKDDGDP